VIDAPVTLHDVLHDAGRALGAAGVDQPRHDVTILAGHALGLSREALFARPDRPLEPAQIRVLNETFARRAAREPVAYILGEREFWSLSFQVGRETLIPRPDSETLVGTALRLVPDRSAPIRIADLGTGSGCLLLSMLSELPGACGVGIDISPGAAAIAQTNARRLGLDARAHFLVADWAAPLSGQFDIVMCNPPYVATDELAALEPEVACFEPRRALHGGADAMASYRDLAPQLARLVAPQGMAVIEFGKGMGDIVSDAMRAVGMPAIERGKDLSGTERCAVFGSARPIILPDQETTGRNAETR